MRKSPVCTICRFSQAFFISLKEKSGVKSCKWRRFHKGTSLFRTFLVKSVFILSVSFLIVSMDFLIVSADAIRKSADSFIVLMREKGTLFALSLSCAILWRLWKGKRGNSIDVFSPRKDTKKAKGHESVLSLGQGGLVRPVRLVRPV